MKLILRGFFCYVLFLVIFCLSVGENILYEYKNQANVIFSEIKEDPFPLNKPTVIYDRNGQVISVLEKDGYYVSYKDINPLLVKTYVAVEDKTFFTNNGLNVVRTIGGIFNTLIHGDKQGGSTITQQVIKNFILSDYSTFDRKVLEWFIAPRISSIISKEEVMELYLNSNFYGNSTRGIEEASLFYFNKSNKDLLPGEIATIVGISNNPTYFNPIRYPDNILAKRNTILKVMLEDNLIDQPTYDEAVSTPINIYGKHRIQQYNDLTTTAIIQTAEKMMVLNEGFQFKYTFKSKEEYNDYKSKYTDLLNKYIKEIHEGNYTIYTSLDVDLTNKVHSKIKSYLDTKDPNKELEIAATFVDVNTNKPLVVVGSRENNGQFNRAIQAYRQPGSAIKPLVAYAPAYDILGINNNYVMNDDRPSKDYPYNYDRISYGNQSMTEAIAKSNNVIPFKLLTTIGVDKGLEILSKLNFKGLSYMDNDNPSVSLGGFTYGTNTMEMAQAYTVFNNGDFVNTSSINKIIVNGVLRYEDKSNSTEVFSSDTVIELREAMEEVLISGTGSSLYLETAYGKTGTTNNNIDGWFCGVYNDISGAVWVGADTPKSIKGLGGYTYPGQLWRDNIILLSNEKGDS